MPRNTTAVEIASNRKFGCEIEFVGISAEAAMRAIIAAGVPCRDFVRYDHRDSPTQWKVVTDSSVDGPGGSGEVVSPILSGDAGLEQARQVCRALSAAGATVNRSCGLHVHVDARDLAARELTNVVFRYARFESDIDAFMPASRRGGNNSYCRSIVDWGRGAARRALLACRQPRQMADAGYSAGTGDRFRKVNLCAFQAHGTVEFRHHSGSVNAEKISNWIKFCVNFVEVSRSQILNESFVEQALRPAPSARICSAPSPRRASGARDSRTLVRLHKIVRALRESGTRGVRISELASLTGWQESSVVVQVSNLRRHYGFSIKRVRYNDSFKILRNGELPALQNAAAADSAPATPVSRANGRPSVNSRGEASNDITPVYGDTAFHGLSAETVAFYSERASELAA
jgi:hypothetical protein